MIQPLPGAALQMSAASEPGPFLPVCPPRVNLPYLPPLGNFLDISRFCFHTLNDGFNPSVRPPLTLPPSLLQQAGTGFWSLLCPEHLAILA